MLRLAALVWMMMVSLSAYAQPEGLSPCDDGPLHEAYITKVTGTYILDAIADQPPKNILERIPLNENEALIWLSGYWQWDADRNDFLWVGGTWRNPPPGHRWVPGFWKQLEEGWVWIRGFWTSEPDDGLEYIENAPPDLLDEEPGPPPSEAYFWMPGYFEYSFSTQSYSWVGGDWQRLDPDWILVCAHYIWRPEGWLFIPAYWDWPVDKRGDAYACLFIDPSMRVTVEYVPWIIIDPWDCVQRVYVYYPDYSCFCHHHWHYHPDLWDSCGCTPPWWYWPTWWCYSWHECWGLWYWYGHPGYPQPHWMSMQMASHIQAPSHKLLLKTKNLKKPFIVTPQGVVKPSVYFKTLANITKQNPGKMQPIVPLKDVKTLQKDVLKQVVEPRQILQPMGKAGEKVILKKPIIDSTATLTPRRKVNIPSRDLKPLKDTSLNKVEKLNIRGNEHLIEKPVIRAPIKSKDQGKNRSNGGNAVRTIIKTPPLRVEPESEEQVQEIKPRGPKIIRRPMRDLQRLQEQDQEDSQGQIYTPEVRGQQFQQQEMPQTRQPQQRPVIRLRNTPRQDMQNMPR